MEPFDTRSSRRGANWPEAGSSGIRLLSVMMPVYNERGTLAEIVARVLDAPTPIPMELVAVDDCSTDGSWELLQALAADDARIRPVRHARNQGKGAAIRTAIAHIRGDVAVVQDADLEYDPAEYPRLLEPILAGQADAVFGSRFVGHPRRVLAFWHEMINRTLTLMSNMLTGLSLTDMETCYKMVRSDILCRLRLQAQTFTFEPELSARLAQWGARIYEVPVSYSARGMDEGKKIRPSDGLRAIGAMLRARFDRRFTDDEAILRQRRRERATRRGRWLFERMRPHLGQRVLELDAARGQLSRWLLSREHVVLAADEPLAADSLARRFGARSNVRIDRTTADNVRADEAWRDDRFDTILCGDALARSADAHALLARLLRLLTPGGRCLMVVPARGAAAFMNRLQGAGFELAASERFDKLGVLGYGRGAAAENNADAVEGERWTRLGRWADRLLPWSGTTLLIVARKPVATSALRTDAALEAAGAHDLVDEHESAHEHELASDRIAA